MGVSTSGGSIDPLAALAPVKCLTATLTVRWDFDMGWYNMPKYLTSWKGVGDVEGCLHFPHLRLLAMQ
jgi:hypothetical protein